MGYGFMLRSIISALALILVLSGTQVTAGVKAPFPDLVDIDGKPVVNQADVGNGKWNLVMIWATNCHVCAEMKPLISDFYDRNKTKNVEVYGIALDGAANVDAVQRYMRDHKVTFPTYIGELDLIALNYEINTEVQFFGTPTYLVFNPEGELVGMDGGMLDIDALEKFIESRS